MEKCRTFVELGQKIKGPRTLEPLISLNRGDGIRTHDLYVPNVALYQTEPHLVSNQRHTLVHLYNETKKKSSKI